jgi:hypothetical protein
VAGGLPETSYTTRDTHRLHRPQRDHRLVAAAIAGDADALHRQEHRKGLAGPVVPAGAPQLLDEDVIDQTRMLEIMNVSTGHDFNTEVVLQEHVVR